MSRIHENLSVRQFEQPDSVETAYVCKKSGLLAVDGVCTGDPRGSMAYTEYFAKGTTPTKSCDVHTAVKVCSSTGLLPTATCTTTTKSLSNDRPEARAQRKIPLMLRQVRPAKVTTSWIRSRIS